MSESPDPPGFEEIDWPEHETARQTVTTERIVLAVGTVLIGSLFLFDRTVGLDVVGIDWRLHRVDWLIMLGGVILAAYVGVPAFRNAEVTRSVLQSVLSRPVYAVPTVVVGVLVFLGVFGPGLLTSPDLRFESSFHPPFTQQVPNAAVGDCQGSTSQIGDTIQRYCHGSLSAYPFGANGDGIAMDYLIADGARTALYVAVFTAAFVVPAATIVGVIAGLHGGLVDDLLMSYVDVQLSIPAIIVYFIGYMYWNPSLLLLLVTFGLLSWGGIARLVRSEVLQRRETGYVKVARSLGAPRGYLARRHILPNITNTLVPAVFQLIALLILVEAGIAFLGFQEAFVYSWGATIAEGVDQNALPAMPYDGDVLRPHHIWWVATFPAVALAGAVVSCKLLGDGLRDALDPRTQH